MQPVILKNFVGHLRRLTAPAGARELSDTELLDRFRGRREEAAFALLVQRHGPMVYAVCRRVLGDSADAEDAFQAAFLTLVRQADAIRQQQSLAGWLHTVASRIAHKTRRQSIHRRQRERATVPARATGDPLDPLLSAELRAALDEEIARLPDKYRMPIVLCYLAEKTHEQAAGELGWPKTSLTSRLARARQLLHERLTRRGFAVPAGLLAVLLTESATNAAVPSVLILSTVRVAVQAGEGVPSAVAALADGALKGAALSKWSAVLLVLASLGLAAAVGHHLSAGSSPPKSEGPALAPQHSENRGSAGQAARKPRVDWQGDPLPDGVLARMGSGRLRHPGGSRTLAFSPDGKSIISAGGHGLRIWDTASGKLRRHLDWGTFDRRSFCLTVDNLFCAELDGVFKVTVRVLDPVTGKVRRQLQIEDPAQAVLPTFSPDGKRLAVAHKNAVQLYDTGTGARTVRLPVKGVVAWDIAFAPDSRMIAFNDMSTGTIYLHDAATGKLVRKLNRPGDSTLHIVFSPDGRFLASMPQSRPVENGEVSVWDLRDGKEVQRLTHPFRMAVSAAFSPDGKRLAVGGGRWGVVVWDVESGKEIRRLSPHGGAYGMAFSLDGQTLAVASPQGAIRLWETATGKLLPISADVDVQDFRHLRFSADGKRLFGEAGACLIWDATTGRELRRFADPGPRDFRSARDMRYLVLSPDETLLAAANRGGTISVWEAATGKEKHVLKGHERSVYDLVFTPDGRRLISCGSDKTIRVWDVSSGRLLHQLHSEAWQLTVSPDSRWLAGAHSPPAAPAVLLWDLTTGQEKKRFGLRPQMMTYQLAFSADSRLLAAVGGTGISNESGDVKIWNVADGRLLHAFDAHKWHAGKVAFSPDNRMLATSGMGDSSLVLWELASGRQRHAFNGHESGIYALAFAPDGRRLAAASVEAPVYVWDVTGILDQKRGRLSQEELQRCWTALAGADAAAAFQSLRRLATAPEQTLPFLRQHLKPVPAPDLERVRQLVRKLDSDEFSERQQATAELKQVADAAAGTLRQMANEKASLYVRRSLQQILDDQEKGQESLRTVRAVEVLEWIGTPEAARLLEELAKGAADARLTREAAAAQERLRRGR